MLLWCIVPTSVVHTTADSFRLQVFKLYLKVHTVHTETSLGASARGFFSPVLCIFHPLVFLILDTLLFETRSKYDQISAPYSFCNSHNRGPPLPLPARADHETNDNSGPLRRCVRLKFYLVLSEFTLQQLWACSTSWQCCTIYASRPGVYTTVFLPVSCGLKMFDSMPCLNKAFFKNRKKKKEEMP